MRALTLAVLLVSGVAFAEPEAQTIYFIDSPTVLAGKGGMIELPVGYFVPEPAFLAIDSEMRRLQFAEVKLTAENKSLRESVDSGAPILAIAIAGLVGVAAGGAAVYFLIPR